jgi:hypothetical protein
MARSQPVVAAGSRAAYVANVSTYVEIGGGDLPALSVPVEARRTYRRCSLIHVGSRRQSTIPRTSAVCSETE